MTDNPDTSLTYTKINVDKLIKQYKIVNIDAFQLYLTGIWKDLASRSDNKYMGINKITFSKYYDLPGILFDRLFSVFDSHQAEYVDLESFLNGMLTLFTKEFDDLVKFVFSFYDFDKDGKISKEDIRIVLSYMPLHQSKTNEKSSSSCGSPNLILNEFSERIASQEELHSTLDRIFKEDEQINQEQFINIVENINSDVFLFLLIFLYEKRPFNNQTIQLLENIKKSPVLNNTESSGTCKLIASPNLNSIFQPSLTITRSPLFKRTKTTIHSDAAGCKQFIKKNSLNTKSDYLQILSGKMIMRPKPRTQAILTFKPNVTVTKQEKNLSHPSRKSKTISANNSIIVNVDLNNNDSNSNSNNSTNNTNNTSSLVVLQPAIKYEENLNNKSLLSNNEHCQQDIFEYNSENDDEEHEHNCDFDLDLQDEENSYSGYIYKIVQSKKLKKLYFSLIYRDLYFYNSEKDTVPKGMHNLSGVFIKEDKQCVIDGIRFFVIAIITQGKTKKYYIDNEFEYTEWLEHLRRAVGYADLSQMYEIKQVIGRGRFGVVKLGINKKTQEKVAIKILCKNELSTFDLEQAKIEIETLKIANHPNIVKLYDVFENADFIYIITEYCEGGDLFSYLEARDFQIKEQRAAQILHQLATAIYFIHQYGIVHRDLKPENILMKDATDDSDIKLLDFGLCKMLGPNEMCNETFGTLSYVAPEILKNQPYNKAVDLWSLGVIAYLLISGFLPFDDKHSDKEIARQTIEDPVPYPSSVWKHISVQAKNLVSSLLQKKPNERISIKTFLEHPWLCKQCNTKLKSTAFNEPSKEKTKGGVEFRIYSSPLRSKKDDESPTNDNDNNNKNSDDNVIPTSSSNNLLTFSKVTNAFSYGSLLIPNLNLPIYANMKKSEDK